MTESSVLYSLKMRASQQQEHISGAEKLVSDTRIGTHVFALLDRALHHAKGQPDFISLKLEKISSAQLMHLDALAVRRIDVPDRSAGLEELTALLKHSGVARGDEIIKMLLESPPMRGAMLIDADTLEHLEPDRKRGIRATYMDYDDAGAMPPPPGKNHFAEALVLATKVANAPRIIGELCISDDPDYVTGYFASKTAGYVRITKLKNPGVPRGGRIFLYRGDRKKVDETIEFLEKQSVAVHQEAMPTPESAPPADRLAKQLNELTESGLHRQCRTNDFTSGTRIVVNGQPLLDLAANDYLALAAHPELKRAAIEAVKLLGVGATGSRLLTGSSRFHADLEARLAEFKNTESALVFNTGYMANVGIISALCGPQSVIFSDELNHASIIDGCRLSRAEVVVYRHCDMDDLEAKLARHAGQPGLVVSDAVFSMDGDVAPAPRLVELARQYGMFSMLDEAHATGVLGETGRGSAEYFRLEQLPDILMGTLSKAVGAEGGFACGSKELIEYLVNRARSFIFSTALPGCVAAAARRGLDLITPERVAQLHANVAFFCTQLRKSKVAVADSPSAIVPIMVGDEARAARIGDTLLEKGIFLSAVRYPAVARGRARLRAALCSEHTASQLEFAARTIAETMEKSL